MISRRTGRTSPISPSCSLGAMSRFAWPTPERAWTRVPRNAPSNPSSPQKAETSRRDSACPPCTGSPRRSAARPGSEPNWARAPPAQGCAPATAGSASPAAARQALASEFISTVLVVDDEAAIREVAHRVLTSAGYQVETAATGHEALGLLADPELTADLILTDIVMPGMTGAALAAQARATRPGLPGLFRSGYEQQGATAEGWPDPAAQIIGKPFSRAASAVRALAARRSEEHTSELQSLRH